MPFVPSVVALELDESGDDEVDDPPPSVVVTLSLPVVESPVAAELALLLVALEALEALELSSLAVELLSAALDAAFAVALAALA